MENEIITPTEEVAVEPVVAVEAPVEAETPVVSEEPVEPIVEAIVETIVA